MSVLNDLTNQKFGKLTAIKISPIKSKSGATWECICECGETVHVSSVNLISGNSKSCGCSKSSYAYKSRLKNGKVKDLKGIAFGELTAVKLSNKRSGTNPLWICLCSCGKEVEVIQENLINGHTKSCGCKSSRSTIGERQTTHGKSNTRLYHIWRGMLARCYSISTEQYHNYGGRGIKVCDDWLKDFQNFYNWAILAGYDETAPFGICTIDRIDVNGNYQPDNCRWVDMKVQACNKRK